MAVVAAAFARLQNNELFKATMVAARAELGSAAESVPDANAREQEAATLALSD